MFNLTETQRPAKYVICPYCSHFHYGKIERSVMKCQNCKDTFLIKQKIVILYTTEKIEIDLK